jgi:hypothetical protein
VYVCEQKLEGRNWVPRYLLQKPARRVLLLLSGRVWCTPEAVSSIRYVCIARA